MKREFAVLIGTAFLISAIPFQLMGWSVTAWIRRDWCSCRMEERLQNPRTY